MSLIFSCAGAFFADEDLVLSLAPDKDGSRLCGVTSCKAILPPIDEYKYKCCDACRRKTRRKARKRKHGTEIISDEEEWARRWKVDEVRGTGGVDGLAEMKFKKMRLTFQGEPVVSLETRRQSPSSSSKESQVAPMTLMKPMVRLDCFLPLEYQH